MPLTKVFIKQIMKFRCPEINTLDDWDKWCAMAKGELQNRIARYFKRLVDFTDYIDYDQYFSYLANVKYIPYNLALFVMSFRFDVQAFHMVHCAGAT